MPPDLLTFDRIGLFGGGSGGAVVLECEDDVFIGGNGGGPRGGEGARSETFATPGRGGITGGDSECGCEMSMPVLPPLQSYSEGTLCIAPFGLGVVAVLVDADECGVAGRGADGREGSVA